MIAGNEALQVVGDPLWLEQLVTALLTNASKFSGPGTSITVRLGTSGDHAELNVIDEGVGLSSGDLEKIFVRYAWLDSRSTANEPQGRSTLARAHQWAEIHGGTLHARSEGPGKGSCFALRLPVKVD